MKHIIQKQIFDLALGPGIEAFGTQHAASRFFRDVLVPLLERAFDELAGEGVVIRVDKLTLDLGVISEDQLTRNFPEQELYARLKEQLRQLMKGEMKATFPAQIPKQVSVFEQWWHYMEKGRLSWNTDKVDAGWYRLVLETLSTDYDAAIRLRQALAEKPVFRKRVSLQHPDVFLETLTGILTGAKQESLSGLVIEACELFSWLEKRSTEPSATPEHKPEHPEKPMAHSLRQWRNAHRTFLGLPIDERKAALWEIVLSDAARRPAEWKSSGAVPVLSRWLSEEDRIHRLLKQAGLDSPLVRSNSRTPHEGSSETGVSAPSGNDAQQQSPREIAPRTPEPDPAIVPPVSEVARVPQSEINSIPQNGANQKSDPATTSDHAREETPVEPLPALLSNPIPASEQAKARQFDRTQLDEDGLFGTYAGLILLHPFLSTFFTRCGLYDEDGFTGPKASQQAVFLLYYLATGEKEAPEHELLFPKLFCGCDPEEPLPISVALPQTTYAEADDLLEMILQRWDKLSNSSKDALREGFLQRTGKLVNRGERFVLIIETSAIDVLLDYLPWNLSIVKLPWLKDLLYVEWR